MTKVTIVRRLIIQKKLDWRRNIYHHNKDYCVLEIIGFIKYTSFVSSPDLIEWTIRHTGIDMKQHDFVLSTSPCFYRVSIDHCSKFAFDHLSRYLRLVGECLPPPLRKEVATKKA